MRGTVFVLFDGDVDAASVYICMSCSFFFYVELTTVPLFGRRFFSVWNCLGAHAVKFHSFECTVCVCECLLFLKF